MVALAVVVRYAPVTRPAARMLTVRDIFRDELPYVWRVLRHLRVPDRDLDDACQEVFLVVADQIGQFRGAASLRTWIYAIAWRVAQNHLRRAHVRREIPSESPARDLAAPAPEDGSTRTALEQVLEALSPEDRVVLVLHEIEEMPMREVAEALEIPVKTAYSRLYAARARAKDLWLELVAQEGKP